MADDQTTGSPSEPAGPASTPIPQQQQTATPPAAAPTTGLTPSGSTASGPAPSGPAPAVPAPSETAPVDSTAPGTTRLDDGPAGPTFRDRLDHWMKRGIAVLVAAIAAVAVYFLLAAFLPRWWAAQIGGLVDGSFTRGIGTGLTIGLVCTLVPLLLIGFAFLSRGRLKNIPALALSLTGVIVAIPNLLTLSVVLGGNNSAHAGQRILDVDAPAFRAASLWGAILAVVVAALVGWFVWGYRRRGKKVRQYKAHEHL